jgi:hypothetical protein
VILSGWDCVDESQNDEPILTLLWSIDELTKGLPCDVVALYFLWSAQMERITISLKEIEKKALLELADKELRDPRAQAALIIRRELERQGLIEPQPFTAPACTAANTPT